jgi:diapolycopene oxygenase
MRDQAADRVIVIGGGLAGLSAACTLAARGHRVTLLERNSWVGGKAAVLEEDGFRFDMGPTILTLPSVLARVFAEAGRDMSDYLTLVPLDPQWRSFFTDGTTLDLHADVDRMSAAIASLTGSQRVARGYRDLIELSARLHEISDRYFFWRSVGGVRDTFNAGTTFTPAVLSDLMALRMGQTVAGTVRRHVPDERVAQMLDHFTQYVGSSPDASPAVLCGIAHMQTDEGVWYPLGGTRAVPVALARLAEDLGVEVRTSTGVKSIELNGKRVRGVVTDDDEMLRCSHIVSNCDAVRTFRELIGGPVADPFLKRRKYEPACSGVVLYLGLRERYGHLLHHNFVFSHDAHEEFDAIYRRGQPAEDPTCYVCAPAITEPQVAPTGGEALYVLVHTPYLRPGQDWRRMLPEYRRKILTKLATTAGLVDLEERIVVERSLTPQDIHERYHVLNGAIYGLASHGTFFGAFKPANRSRDIHGLYLAGGAAHPGPGMPMVLMSGWIAADALDHDHGGNTNRAHEDLVSATR